MFRATTPLHSFVFDVNIEEFEKILVTYAHGPLTFLEKTKDDLTFTTRTLDNGSIKYVASLRLTQEEANRFRADGNGKNTYVQIRALDSNGHAYATDKKMINVKGVLDDHVLRSDGSGNSNGV